MKMKPILFSTPMVQAILENRKNQTRRVLKPQICPYKAGDILWVRETSCYVMLDHAHDLLEGAKERNQTIYKSDVHPDWMEYANSKYGYKWTPSIFMPKDACRLFLRITDVRAERLQEISEFDAIREGVEYITRGNVSGYKAYTNDSLTFNNAIYSFKTLWMSINGEKSWQNNPFVWVISFEKIENPLLNLKNH